MKLNLGCGKKTFPVEEGWLNVDRTPYQNVETRDLFSYPWEWWEDNSCDEFYIGHFAEHIPHEPRACYNARFEHMSLAKTKRRWSQLKDLDGFFAFFAEVWRVGVPGARVRVVSPYGLSNGAFQDPTHTRYLVPQTFIYLKRERDGEGTLDYRLPFEFKVITSEVSTSIPIAQLPNDIMGWDDARKNAYIEDLVRRQWNYGQELNVEMEIVK